MINLKVRAIGGTYLKNKKQLINKLNSNLGVISVNHNRHKSLVKYLNDKHNIPTSKSASFISGIHPLEEASDEMLYLISKAIVVFGKEHIGALPEPLKIDDYYTENEIAAYEKYMYVIPEEESNYPIVFKDVVPITADQWITVVDTDFLYDLYNKQVINYNRNTQRQLTVKTINGVETYHISIVKQSVKEIKEQLLQGSFVPNAITLNLNLDNSEVDFSVNKNDLYLNAGQLDIIDGYHRFRAMLEAKREDENFNYQVIVNIMNFDESKANAFIAQEDKRNKIKKAYVKSIDTNSLYYFIVHRLNTNPDSAIKGEVGQYGKKISQTGLNSLIEEFFLVESRQDAIGTCNRLMDVINTYVDKTGSLPNFRSLCIIIKVASLSQNAEKSYEIIRRYENNSNFLSSAVVKRENLTKGIRNALNTINE